MGGEPPLILISSHLSPIISSNQAVGCRWSWWLADSLLGVRYCLIVLVCSMADRVLRARSAVRWWEIHYSDSRYHLCLFGTNPPRGRIFAGLRFINDISQSSLDMFFLLRTLLWLCSNAQWIVLFSKQKLFCHLRYLIWLNHIICFVLRKTVLSIHKTKTISVYMYNLSD